MGIKNTVLHSMDRPGELVVHIMSNCTLDPDTHCLLWQGGRSTQGGYATLWCDGRIHFVHRLVFELFAGDLPDGSLSHSPDSIEVHHSCGERVCCNPRHITTMSRSEHSKLHWIERRSKLLNKCPA